MAFDQAAERVIEQAFEAALQPELWPSTLAALVDVLGADKTLVVTPRAARPEDLPGARVDPAHVALYFQRFEVVNPIQAALDRARARGLVEAAPLVDRALVPDRDLVRSDFYDVFMRQTDYHGALMIPLGGETHVRQTINVFRSARRDLFDRTELELAQALMRPLAGAWRLGRTLEAERAAKEAFVAYLARLPGAVLLTDAAGKVLFANPAAEALLADGDGVTASQDGLRARDASAQRRLARLIGLAAAGSSPAGGSMNLPRASGRRPLTAFVAPARADGAQGPRLALVSINDPERSASAPQRLAELFGFTPSEARVVDRLAAGADLKEIAEHLSVSVSAVRFHLAHALDKTGVHRQAELVALVLRTLAGAPEI